MLVLCQTYIVGGSLMSAIVDCDFSVGVRLETHLDLSPSMHEYFVCTALQTLVYDIVLVLLFAVSVG